MFVVIKRNIICYFETAQSTSYFRLFFKNKQTKKKQLHKPMRIKIIN